MVIVLCGVVDNIEKQRNRGGGNAYRIEQSILLSAGTSNFLRSKGAHGTNECKGSDDLHTDSFLVPGVARKINDPRTIISEQAKQRIIYCERSKTQTEG
jgi:hypothetical protein